MLLIVNNSKSVTRACETFLALMWYHVYFHIYLFYSSFIICKAIMSLELSILSRIFYCAYFQSLYFPPFEMFRWQEEIWFHYHIYHVHWYFWFRNQTCNGQFSSDSLFIHLLLNFFVLVSIYLSCWSHGMQSRLDYLVVELRDSLLCFAALMWYIQVKHVLMHGLRRR